MEDFRAARKMFSEGVVYLIIYLLLIIIIIYSSIICLFIYLLFVYLFIIIIILFIYYLSLIIYLIKDRRCSVRGLDVYLVKDNFFFNGRPGIMSTLSL